jgi:hypothetical protein
MGMAMVASGPVHRAVWILAVSLVSIGCTRTGSPVATVEPGGTETTESVVLSEYVPGSSCKLILDEDNIYWLELSLDGAPVRAEHRGFDVGLFAAPAPVDAGMVPICESATTALHRIPRGGGVRETVLEFDDWAWRFAADEHSFYWLSICKAGVVRVARVGGEPSLVDPGYEVMGYLPGSDGRVYMLGADRQFGAIDRVDPATLPIDIERLVEPGERTILLGVDDRELAFAIAVDSTWHIRTRTHATGELRELGRLELQPIGGGIDDGHLALYTASTIVAYELQSSAEQFVHEIPPYEDRGELWFADGSVAWGDGPAGTINRASLATGELEQATVDGEPCGVASDERYLYWLDREGGRIFRRVREAVSWRRAR